MGMIDAAIILKASRGNVLYVAVIGGLYFVRECTCGDLTGKNRFEDQERRILGFFLLIDGNDPIPLPVSRASQTYMHMAMVVIIISAELLRLERMRILACSALIGHGYLQHGECFRCSSHGLW